MISLDAILLALIQQWYIIICEWIGMCAKLFRDDEWRRNSKLDSTDGKFTFLTFLFNLFLSHTIVYPDWFTWKNFNIHIGFPYQHQVLKHRKSSTSIFWYFLYNCDCGCESYQIFWNHCIAFKYFSCCCCCCHYSKQEIKESYAGAWVWAGTWAEELK